MQPQLADNENDRSSEHTDGCSVCGELLANLGRFVERIEAIRAAYQGEWLTVEEVAGELKLSKSIVYRIRRSALTRYLEGKRVKPLPSPPARAPVRRFPKVKNHLEL